MRGKHKKYVIIYAWMATVAQKALAHASVGVTSHMHPQRSFIEPSDLHLPHLLLHLAVPTTSDWPRARQMPQAHHSC